MTGEDKSYIYKTLNELTALLLRGETLGETTVIAADRQWHNDLLAKIAEAKRILVRPPTKEITEF